MYRVRAFVRDRDLEAVLNDDGWELVEMWRNTPGKDGEETTTVVQREPGWSVTYSDPC